MSRNFLFVKYILTVLIMLFVGYDMPAQENLPEKPVIEYVTVDSDCGQTKIKWNPSSSPDIDFYKIYYLELTQPSYTGWFIDSVPADSLSYCHMMEAYEPLIYTITALDIYGNESLLEGDFHKPVKLDIAYDSCNSSMQLAWENYIGWKNSLSGYRIFVREENEEAFRMLDLVDTLTLSFTHEGILENSTYEYRIEAFNNQLVSSISNDREYFTYMPPPPQYLTIDYVTVLEDQQTVELSFTADVSGEINDFAVYRARSKNGEFELVQSYYDLTTENIVLNDAIAAMGEQFFYKVYALNSCEVPVDTSNLSNNIILRGEVEESVIRLNWSPYETYGSGVAEYAVRRESKYGEIETVAHLPSTTTSYSEVYTNLASRGSIDSLIHRGEFKYSVVAEVTDYNPLGKSYSSTSNQITVDVETNIITPNAFTPNNDSRNDYFKPIFDFVPRDFTMYIYDRSGKVLYRSSDPSLGWDGRMNGGRMAPEGVYIYHIEYRSYNGVGDEITGNLTLIYP